MAKPLQKLLRANISKAQTAAYLLANILGLLILTAALQFYIDTRAALSPELRKDRFITLSKPVTLFAGAPSFSQDEIDDLRQQPWVLKADGFSSNRFPVSATVSLGGRGLSSKFFFEAVPDSYLDAVPAGWREFAQNPDAPIPILIPRDYLTLYNFGFAPAQGLPQVTESLLSAIPLWITMGDGFHTEQRQAIVAGFTERLNTIAVPLEFLDEANLRLAPDTPSEPERLIVETTSPDDPAIDAWLNAHGIERNSSSTAPQLGRLLAAGASTVGVIGLIISCLSLIILFLSVHLLLQKSRLTLRRLMLLGYTPSTLAVSYIRLTTILNFCVAVGTVAALLMLRPLWLNTLRDMGLAVGTIWIALATAVGLLLVVSLLAAYTIMRTMRRIWHGG